MHITHRRWSARSAALLLLLAYSLSPYGVGKCPSSLGPSDHFERLTDACAAPGAAVS